MTARLLAPKWRKKITSKKAESYEAGRGGLLWTSECFAVKCVPSAAVGAGMWNKMLGTENKEAAEKKKNNQT